MNIQMKGVTGEIVILNILYVLPPSSFWPDLSGENISLL